MARYIYGDNLEDGNVELTPAPNDHRTPAMTAAVHAEYPPARPVRKLHLAAQITEQIT